MQTVCFISLGCPKNQVDSEVMLGHLTQEGYALVSDPAKSHIIIINTCAFIEDAKKESIDTILEMAAFRKSGSCTLLIVVGCLPQRYREELAKSMPEVDLFIGTGELPRLVELIRSHDGTQRVEVGKPTYMYSHTEPRMLIGAPHAAYLKIAEGCFHPCSFCVVPKVRGAFRSRPLESIMTEAALLIARGVKELNVIAQDTTGYGRDLKEDVNLGVLLRRLAHLVGEKWIRALYAYPHDFPESVIGALRECKDVVKYLDLPVQHVSTRILKSMRRGGDAREIRLLIEKLRYYIPSISLRTSLIVGYPGETEKEFEELIDFVCEMKFDNLGVFVYSPEEGTPAAMLTPRIPRTVADDRVRELMSLQREISYDLNRQKVGREYTVLVDGVSEESEHLLVGRHEGQAPDIDGVVYINEGYAAPGTFAKVKIVEAHEYDLVAKIV